MNKEEIEKLLDKLDLEEWSTPLYKVPLTWCELYDIREYIKQKNKIVEVIKEYCADELKFLYAKNNHCKYLGEILQIEHISEIIKEVEKGSEE